MDHNLEIAVTSLVVGSRAIRGEAATLSAMVPESRRPTTRSPSWQSLHGDS